MNPESKAITLSQFVGKPYKYDTYHYTYEYGSIGNLSILLECGLLRGHAIHQTGKNELRGYIGITELGKTWLEFNEL